MELRQLEYFITICKTLHFTKAAELLHITQPTLSQQIRNLEEEIGTPLFDRIGKKTALTEAGNILLSHAKQIFHEIDEAKAAVHDLHLVQRGSLKLGTLLTCMNYLLPPAILDFKKSYANIDLQILGLPMTDIISGLLDNELDIGIGFLPVKHEELDVIPLFTEELSLAAPLSHPFAKRTEIQLSELEQTKLILLPQHYVLRQLIDTYCADAGIMLCPTLEMSTMDALIQMVANEIGVTILPKPYLDAIQTNSCEIVKLTHPTPKREIGFIFRKDKFMCTATKSFIDKVTQTSNQL